MVRAAWLITAKDVRLQVRQRSVLVLGLLAPLTLAFVLNLVFGGFGDDPDAPVTFDVGFVDADGGAAAERFRATVDAVAGIGLVEVTTYDDEPAARAAVDAGDVGAAWVVPEGHSEAVAGGGEARLRVIGDVDAPTTTAVARAVAERHAAAVGTATLAATVAVASGAAPPEEAAAVAEEVAAAGPLLAVTATDVGPPSLDLTTSLTAGLALFFAFFTAGLPLMSVMEERQAGTLARLLVAPIPPAAVVTGKALAALGLGTCSLVTLMVASHVLMGARWGPPAGALLLAVAGVVAVTGIMGLTGAFARTAEQAGSAQAIVAVVLGIAGGTFVPVEGGATGLLGQVRRLTPNGWFIDGLTDLAEGGVGAALPAVAVLLGMGLVTGAGGLLLSRSALRR